MKNQRRFPTHNNKPQWLCHRGYIVLIIMDGLYLFIDTVRIWVLTVSLAFQMTHWQSPYMHAYFPALNSPPSLLGDMLADAINCLGFTWVSIQKAPDSHLMFYLPTSEGNACFIEEYAVCYMAGCSVHKLLDYGTLIYIYIHTPSTFSTTIISSILYFTWIREEYLDA